MKISKDLVAASAAPLVLSLLQEGESYGYAIIQRVKDLSQGKVEWTDGMLYPVLHRLEEQGLIQSAWRLGESGRKRKYYAITSRGKQELTDHQTQWEVVHSTLMALWRPGYA